MVNVKMSLLKKYNIIHTESPPPPFPHRLEWEFMCGGTDYVTMETFHVIYRNTHDTDTTADDRWR